MNCQKETNETWKAESRYHLSYLMEAGQRAGVEPQHLYA